MIYGSGEPTLSEMLSDTLIRLVMRADGVDPEKAAAANCARSQGAWSAVVSPPDEMELCCAAY